jgi:hypothetical protein
LLNIRGIVSVENVVSAAVELVRRHFSALADYDWPTLESSVSSDAHMRLVGVSNFKWTPTTIYRHVTQAWDLSVREVHFTDQGGGIVRAKIHLANDLQAKEIEGEYLVAMGRIDAIILTDAVSAKA